MFSGIYTVCTDEEWMRTRKAALTLKKSTETIGDAFNEIYSPSGPAELTYIVVIGDSSKLKVEASDESGSEVTEVANICLSCNTTFEPRIMASVD